MRLASVVSVHAKVRQEEAENPLKSRLLKQNIMRKISSTTLITFFLFLCVAGIQAQTDTQADKLMNALKEEDNTNALILAKNVNVKDVNRIIGNNSLLWAAAFHGFSDVCSVLLEKGALVDLQSSKTKTTVS